MGMINHIFRKQANYFIVSLFAFLSICFTSNSYANNEQDIAELEAFYYLIFEDNTEIKKPVNTKTHTNFSKEVTKPTKVIIDRKSKHNAKVKDPELVAFYESIFGTSINETEVKAAPIPSSHAKYSSNKSSKISIDKLNTFNQVQKIKHSSLSIELNDSINKNFVTTEDSDEVINNTIVVDEETTADQIIINSSNEKSDKEKDSGTGVLDNNLLSSQVQKTDTKTLFEKAIDKKQDKVKTISKNVKTNASANDMASLFAKAFGKKTASVIPSKVKVDFRINTQTIGEIELFSNNSGDIDQVDTKNLIKLLEEVLKDHVLLRAKEQLKNNKKTLLSDLSKLGISAIYNSTNLSLDAEIKPEFRKPQILSLANKKRASVREENKVEAQKVSGFLNAFSNIGLNSRNDDTELRMRLEGSLNINGIVFETTSDYRDEEFDLGRTSLTYDRPEKLQRFSLGNISTGSRNFQENLELDGIRISKEFFLDPDLQITPRANESLQLNSDSEVELYINNQLIRRFYLKAGVYSLQDIGLYNGANNIQIRIKDEFGKVTVKTSQQYYDSHLLKPGLSLFAISVGYLSNQQSYSNSEHEKSPIFSGYYQKGLTKDLTLSIDAQLSSDNFLLGAESISSISIGAIKNSVAISGGKERNTGFASSFEFKPNKKQEQINLDTLRQDLLGLDTTSKGFLNNWSITGEYRSKDFLVLNGINPDLTGSSEVIDGVTFGNRVFNNNQLRGNIQTNFNLNINEKWQGSLNVGAADYYDVDDSYYANLSATRRFENGTRLSIGTRYDTEDEFSMNLQLSIPLSRKKGKKRVDLDVLADSRTNAYETKLSVKPTSFIGKNSLGGSLEHFEDEDTRQENLDIQYRNTNFESKFTARNTMNKGSNSSSQQFNVGFNTAIACVGGSCASSYPINDSFALVSGPSNQTSPIAISSNGLRFRYSEGNDTGLPDNYSALITGKGKKAIVRLDSYRTQNINIDEGTLPIGYDSEKTEFSVFPKYNQGFLLKAGGEPATTLDGMLFDDQNNFLSFKGGQWVPVNDGKIVAFFSNKGGKFRVTSIPAGKYKLELFDYPDMEPISISVPDTKGKAHDIGKLIIKTPN
ncbi:MAG: outer membrane usher protein [Cocleimonas sp.]|jgi:outer membrane usher protein